VTAALQRAGIDVDPGFLEKIDHLPGMLMKKYEGRPEFERSHFEIP